MQIFETLSQEKVTETLAFYPSKPKKQRIGFGYQVSDHDPKILVPIPNIIVPLHFALNQLDAGEPLRVVRDWLNLNTPEGVSISHAGLSNLWDEYRPTHTKRNAVVRKLTPEQRSIRARKHQIKLELQRAKAAEKKLKKLTSEVTILEENDLSDVPSTLVVPAKHLMAVDTSGMDEDLKDIEPLFKPNPGPQTAFFAAEEQEVLYGGAAGGGKSYALITDPIRYFEHPKFYGLILRRTNDELRELIWKQQELYPQLPLKGGRPVWREKDKEWRFPAGGRLWMSYLERDEDVRRYQGQAFSYIAFDELTQYGTPFPWNYMRSRLRTTASDLPTMMRATSNPGGIGHGWVKKMFVDPAPYGEPFWALGEKDEILLHPRTKVPLFQRRFIPAKLKDNPYLYEDGKYEANLLGLPEQERRQLLEGDWNVADGAAFSEFRTDLHVIKPYDIPRNWRRFRSADYGYSSRQASAVHWYVVNPLTDQIVVYRELYIQKLTGVELSEKIREIETAAGENMAYGVLDASCWAQRGQSGPSIAEEMIGNGTKWMPSDRSPNSRISGKNRLHELLRTDPVLKEPGIVFFNTCRHIINTLPIIPMDKESDDIDPKFVDDHSYDSLRYGIMSRPRANNPYVYSNTGSSKMDYRLDGVFGY